MLFLKFLISTQEQLLFSPYFYHIPMYIKIKRNWDYFSVSSFKLPAVIKVISCWKHDIKCTVRFEGFYVIFYFLSLSFLWTFSHKLLVNWKAWTYIFSNLSCIWKFREVLGLHARNPLLCVPGALAPGGKVLPGRDSDHTPPSSAEVK
jgi:hypothetical protein